MNAADGICRHGFRRWYERQLIEGHAWFVTCFPCAILILASLEGCSLRAPGLAPVGTLALVVGSAALCVVSLRRYLAILARAEYVAERSTCSACGDYGSLAVLTAAQDGGARRRDAPSQMTTALLPVSGCAAESAATNGRSSSALR